MTCTACALHKHVLTVCVQGRGSETPTILLVGQNPGKEEDLAGEAFVGKSGKLLDAMLTDAGIDLSTVRRTNAVRCVTPENRAPSPDEVSACSPHLVDEIMATRPQVIVALGDVALKALVGNRAISSVRGQELALHPRFGYPCTVIPTWHPARVLRVPQARNTVVSDLRRVRDRNTQHAALQWKMYEGEAVPSRLVAYDVETFNATGGIDDEVTQVAVSLVDHPTLVSVENRWQLLRAIEPLDLVSHNGWAFDDLKTGLDSKWDTRVMAYLDDETQPLNLESLCVKYLGVRGWKEDRAGAVLGSQELLEYNARDAENTLRLFYELYHNRLNAKQITIIQEILRPARKALTAASQRGVYIDGEAVAGECARATVELETARQAVLREVADSGFPQDSFNVELKTKTKAITFNPNSGAHVAAVINHLGYGLPQTRKSGKLKTDAETLARINHPFVRAMETYRELAKRKSTYIDPYLGIANEDDGRAHTAYKLCTTVTGRSASEKPNVQNLDRTLKHFKSAPPGKVLSEYDYAGIEFRMGAWIANETVIIENYAKDALWDPHAYFAAILYNVSLEEIKAEPKSPNSRRQLAKSANFSQEFWGDEHTLYKYILRELGIEMPMPECSRIHRSWHRTFPGWKPFYNRVWEELVSNGGYVEGLTGQRRHIGDLSLLNKQQCLEAWREVVNFKVQNFCAHLAFLALRFCWEHALPIVDFVHDSIAFEWDSMEQATQNEALVRFCMVTEPLRILREKWGLVPSVPLEVEVVHRAGAEQVPSGQQVA